MFCQLSDLHNESDVEQKFIYPLLTLAIPNGLGYKPIDIRTKADLRQIVIDKGRSEKLYYPDYLILIAGFPIFVFEAKRPGEDLAEALREARLYANALNASLLHGINPCVRVAASDGSNFVSSPVQPKRAGYYSGDESFVKNLFQCDPTDVAPDHLARVAVLIWLDRHFRVSGPNGVEGFHPVRRVISDLAVFGHDADRLIAEVEYLVKEQCIMTEHQRPTVESLDDLIALSPAGHVHVSLLSNATYVAACSEDTWVANEKLAKDVAERIGQYGAGTHYSRGVTAANCEDMLSYLRDAAAKRYRKSADFCDPNYVNDSPARPTVFWLTPGFSPLAVLYCRANTYGNRGVRFTFQGSRTRGVSGASALCSL